MTSLAGISWRRPAAAPATQEQIAAVERSLGVRYPEDFRALAPAIHGASPSPDEFALVYPRNRRRSGGFISVVLSFDPGTGYDFVLKLVEAQRRDGVLPAGVVPFGKDGGGDMVAFDFRRDPVNPPVVYVASTNASDDEGDEGHIVPLADSFTGFLAMLHDTDGADPIVQEDRP